MALIRIPYKFEGSATFQTYNTVMARVNAFSNVVNIGKDSSNTYDMRMIRMGNSSKPPILFISGMHPPEWGTILYGLSFFEQLRDDTFPDKKFRDELLSRFYLLYVPLVNPWGYVEMEKYDVYAQFAVGRETFNDVDLNEDFYAFTQAESQNIKTVVDTYKPFSFLDAHMFQQEYSLADGKNLILGNGEAGNTALRKRLAQSWFLHTGHEVQEWTPDVMLPTSGLARRYVRDTINPHTSQTLSYITELVKKSTGFPEILTQEQIYSYGMAFLYLFYKTSMDFFYKRAQ